MLRKLLSIAGISLALGGCVDLPKKPTLRMCVIDYPRGEGICGEKEPGKPVSTMTRTSLESLDKATALEPFYWEQLQNYIQMLELYAQACSQKKK